MMGSRRVGYWRRMLVALAAGGALVMAGCGSEDDHDGHSHTGSDAGEHIDPVAEDAAIAATSVAVTLLNWTPAQQDSPWDVSAEQADIFTGELAAKITDLSGENIPEQWAGWAAAGATVRSVVLDAEVTDESETEAKVIATVRQELAYPDGGRSTWKTSDYDIGLVAEDGRWKADTMKEKS